MFDLAIKSKKIITPGSEKEGVVIIKDGIIIDVVNELETTEGIIIDVGDK